MTQPSVHLPPWKLRGNAYVIFFRFDAEFARQWTPAALHERWRGGIGGVAFVDYTASPVGAYRELMLIPGRFQDGNKPRHSITRIFVSSYASMIGGRENWGIPKERADFDVQMLEDGSDRLTVLALGGETIAELHVRQGFVKLPIPTTRLCPLTISQWYEGNLYRTSLWGSGRVSLLDVQSIWADGVHFPDLSAVPPIGAFKLSEFRLTFPAAKVSPVP